MLDELHLDKIEKRILDSEDPSAEFDSIRGELRAVLLDQALLGAGPSYFTDTFAVTDEGPETRCAGLPPILGLFFQLALEEWIDDLMQTCDGGRITWHLPLDEIKITTFRFAYKEVDTNEVLIR